MYKVLVSMLHTVEVDVAATNKDDAKAAAEKMAKDIPLSEWEERWFCASDVDGLPEYRIGDRAYYYYNPDLDPTRPADVFNCRYIHEGVVMDISKEHVTIVDSVGIAETYPIWAVAPTVPLLTVGVNGYLYGLLDGHHDALCQASADFLSSWSKSKNTHSSVIEETEDVPPNA